MEKIYIDDIGNAYEIISERKIYHDRWILAEKKFK